MKSVSTDTGTAFGEEMPLGACYANPSKRWGSDTDGMLIVPRYDNAAIIYLVAEIVRGNPQACVRLTPSAVQKTPVLEYGLRCRAKGRVEICACSEVIDSHITSNCRPYEAAKRSLRISRIGSQGTRHVEDTQNVVAQGGSQRPWAKESSCAGIILEAQTEWKETKGNSTDRLESRSPQVRRPAGSSAVLPRGARSGGPSPRYCSALQSRKRTCAVEIIADPRNLIGDLCSVFGSADQRGGKLHTIISGKRVRLRRAPIGPGRHHCLDVVSESRKDWTHSDEPANSAALCCSHRQPPRVKREKTVLSYRWNLGRQHSVTVGRGEHPISTMPRGKNLEEASRGFRKTVIGVCVTLDHSTGSPVPIRLRTRSDSAAARASSLAKRRA